MQVPNKKERKRTEPEDPKAIGSNRVEAEEQEEEEAKEDFAFLLMTLIVIWKKTLEKKGANMQAEEKDLKRQRETVKDNAEDIRKEGLISKRQKQLKDKREEQKNSMKNEE